MTTIKINDNMQVTTLEDGTIAIEMKEHQDLEIHAEDKYRKGITLIICDGCKAVCIGTLSGDNIDLCDECGLKHIRGEL